jgi:competence protein ComEC
LTATSYRSKGVAKPVERRSQHAGGHDKRLLWPAAAAWVAAIVADGVRPSTGATIAVVACIVGVVAGWFRLGAVTGAAVGVVAAGTSAAVHLAALASGPVPLAAKNGAHATVTMTIVRDPVHLTSRGGFSFVLVDATVTSYDGRRVRSPVVVLAHGRGWDGLLPGQQVQLRGRFRPPRHGDYVSATVLAIDAPRLLGRPPPWQRAAGRVRVGLENACARLPLDERGLVPGLVIGDTSAMPPDLTTDFRVAGLTHLCAVSGENLAIMLATVAAVVRRLGLARRMRTVLTGLALVGFVVLARPSPSVLRAAVMGVVALAAVALGRPRQALASLCLAVLVLVVADPFLARQPGFALSVLATASILWLAPPLTRRLSRRMPRWLAAAIAIPAAAQLVCTPVIVAVFGQASPYAVLANLLAAPAVAPATIGGLVVAIVAVVSHRLAVVLCWLAALPSWWLATVARGVARLPGAGLRFPAGWASAAVVTAVFLIAALVARRRRGGSDHAMLAAWPA